MAAEHTDKNGSDYWKYWQHPAIGDRRWEAEADDLITRLCRLLRPMPEWKVLDYGCGQGLVAARLAPLVARLDLWDASAVAREQSRQTCQHLDNVCVLTHLSPQTEYDFILVSSVTQYLTEPELNEAVIAWKQLLRPGGRILVTDIIPPRRRVPSEIIDLLRFAVRYRVMTAMLVDGLRRFPAYLRNSRQQPLTHYSPEWFVKQSAELGLRAQQVTNPNIFSARYAMLLQ